MIAAVSAPSVPVVRPNSLQAFKGVWHLTWRRMVTPGQWFFLLGMIVFMALLTLVRIRNGQVSDYVPWTIEFYLGFIIPVMAFLSGAASIRDEMKSSTSDYILTRPVRRVHLVVFKYLCHLACVQVFYLVVLGSILVLAAFIHVPDIVSAVPRMMLAQVTALTCFTALGFLFGVISARYLILGIIYAGTVEMAIGRIPTQLNHLSMSHQLDTLLQPLAPSGLGLLVEPSSAATIVTMLFGYAAIFLTLCAIVFSRREMAGAGRDS